MIKEMTEEIQVIDLAPVEEPAQPAPEEAAPPPPPPLERQESVLAPVSEEAEAPQPKRRGRPPGSKNVKPRQPKPPKPPAPPEEEEDTPRPPTSRVRMQAPYHEAQDLEMAQTLLNLMHAQAGARASKRQQLYRSWF